MIRGWAGGGTGPASKGQTPGPGDRTAVCQPHTGSITEGACETVQLEDVQPHVRPAPTGRETVRTVRGRTGLEAEFLQETQLCVPSLSNDWVRPTHVMVGNLLQVNLNIPTEYLHRSTWPSAGGSN